MNGYGEGDDDVSGVKGWGNTLDMGGVRLGCRCVEGEGATRMCYGARASMSLFFTASMSVVAWTVEWASLLSKICIRS